MTWEEANLSLQLAAEERVGFVMRRTAEIARGQEDAMAAAQVTSMGGKIP